MVESELELKTPLWEKLAHLPYLFLYGFVKYVPSPFGFILRWPVLKLFGLKCGWGYVYEGVTIQYPWRVHLGRGWSLNEGVYIGPGGHIFIGSDTRIAARVTIVSTNHIYKDPSTLIKHQGHSNAPIRIGSDVWIGAHAVILAGVQLGNGSVVGASSLVNKSVMEREVVAGNPITVIGHR